MSTPDEIRADIERTRGELGSDVDALADKVSPSSIAHRQSEKVKGRFQDVRESVMGAAQSARSSASGSASGATGQARTSRRRASRRRRATPWPSASSRSVPVGSCRRSCRPPRRKKSSPVS